MGKFQTETLTRFETFLQRQTFEVINQPMDVTARRIIP